LVVQWQRLIGQIARQLAVPNDRLQPSKTHTLLARCSRCIASKSQTKRSRWLISDGLASRCHIRFRSKADFAGSGVDVGFVPAADKVQRSHGAHFLGARSPMDPVIV
jgi:hypothetical protein